MNRNVQMKAEMEPHAWRSVPRNMAAATLVDRTRTSATTGTAINARFTVGPLSPRMRPRFANMAPHSHRVHAANRSAASSNRLEPLLLADSHVITMVANATTGSTTNTTALTGRANGWR